MGASHASSRFIAVAAAAMAAAFAPAEAASRALETASLTSGAAAAAPAAAMREGETHAGPLGWRVLCRTSAEVCAPPAARRPGAIARLGREGFERLAAFNAAINAGLRPASDLETFGAVDVWRIAAPGDAADCEDYALTKRARLIEAGWPPETVLIGVVEGTLTPYHAVLVLRTDRGDLVLDNLTNEIRDWRESGYVWVVRQSSRAPETWVRVVDEAR